MSAGSRLDRGHVPQFSPGIGSICCEAWPNCCPSFNHPIPSPTRLIEHGNPTSILTRARSSTGKLQSLAMADQGLFSADLLSPEVQAALPEGYQLRALRRTDFDAGFLDCLRVLTTVGDIPKEKWEERYDWIARQDGTYFVLVIEDTNASPPRIVGTGALLAERKL